MAQIRSEILALAETMQAKLDAHAERGESWKQDTIFSLWRRMGQEHVELARAIMKAQEAPVMTRELIDEISKECADVANFCAFIHDNVSRMEGQPNAQVVPKVQE